MRAPGLTRRRGDDGKAADNPDVAHFARSELASRSITLAQGRANHFDLCDALLLVQNSGMAESGGSTSVQWFGPLNEYVGSATASFVG